jgi:acyl-CoA synthetase (AMP-forming)/AMP-acid ligase II
MGLSTSVAPGSSSPTGSRTSSRAAASGSRRSLPDTVIYLDALPRTSVGKLDKKAMRAAYAGVYLTRAPAESASMPR